MPPVTGYALKGGVSNTFAQFDLGKVNPSVPRPSYGWVKRNVRFDRFIVGLKRF